MKPLRGLKFSGKNLCLAWLRKNLAGHTQAEGCPPSFLKALDGADETSCRPLVSVILPLSGAYCRGHRLDEEMLGGCRLSG